MSWLRFIVFVIIWGGTFSVKAGITSFTCPGIDDSHIVINPSACNAADGSITGIIGTGGTGTLTYTWYTLDNVVLSTSADLLNMPAGSYILEIKDQSKCLPAKKTYNIGQRFSAIIDTSQIKITPSSCTANNGSITNISVTNATQYQWFDLNKNPLATNSDLINVPSGLYTLVVTAATGCTFTKAYQVPSSAHFPTVAKTDTTMGICGYTVGTYTLTFNLSPTDPIYSYQLLDPTGAVASGDAGPISGALLYTDGSPVQITFPIESANVPFTLVLTQTQNYCSSVVGTYSLPEPVFALANGPFFKVTNDACGRHTGGVSGLLVVGGSPLPANPLPQKYTWTDSLGNVVGRQPELSDVGKGTYTVVVVDMHGCTATRQFTITDSTAEALPPAINGITLCLPGATTLLVNNPNPAYKYRLYDSSQTPIEENSKGIFQEKVTQTTIYYVTSLTGLCESLPTKVTITVVAPGVIIPNTFTPNNDGINDYWNLPHIYDFPGAEVSIFTRDGQVIYHSISYPHPFDGKYNGENLPAGVYYYLIDLKTPECFGKISGSLTLIR